jgi:hypothetical protein
MKPQDPGTMKRTRTMQLLEQRTRLKKWLCTCILAGSTLLTLAVVWD